MELTAWFGKINQESGHFIPAGSVDDMIDELMES